VGVADYCFGCLSWEELADYWADFVEGFVKGFVAGSGEDFVEDFVEDWTAACSALMERLEDFRTEGGLFAIVGLGRGSSS
jgi:hypothetical protein